MMNIGSTIKKLIRKHYISTRMLFEYKMRRDRLDPQPVVIYQMGKVGSTSILHSLEMLNKFSNVFQVHVLSGHGIGAMEKRYWGNTPMLFRASFLPETTHVFIAHALKSRIRSRSDLHWKFITLVRDPVARNVSEFFYSVDTTKSDPHLPDFYERYHAGKITTAELVERFLQRFSDTSEEYAVPLTWFDDELRGMTGIDIYSTPFAAESGYQILKKDNMDLLILKLERLKECYRPAFSEFMGLADFNLVNANTASEKNYYSAYQSFMKEVNLPLSYLQKVYGSKYVRHFYGEQEIEQFIRKWHKA